MNILMGIQLYSWGIYGLKFTSTIRNGKKSIWYTHSLRVMK